MYCPTRRPRTKGVLSLALLAVAACASSQSRPALDQPKRAETKASEHKRPAGTAKAADTSDDAAPGLSMLAPVLGEEWRSRWRDHEPVGLPPEWCAYVTRTERTIPSECGAVPVGQARAAFLVLRYGCGPHACKAGLWLLRENDGQARFIAETTRAFHKLYQGLELDRDQQHVVYDDGMDETDEVVRTFWQDVATARRQTVAGVFSCVSHASDGYICRNRAADLVYTQLPNGPNSIAAKSLIAPSDIAIGGGMVDYPDDPVLLEDGRVRCTTYVSLESDAFRESDDGRVDETFVPSTP